jgi:GH18 family chitinase
MKINRYLLAAVLFILWSMCHCVTEKSQDQTEADAGMWVMADHPMYQWGRVPADAVPWEHITHLNIGYLWPVKSGDGYTVGTPPNSWWSGGWGGMTRWRRDVAVYIQNAPSGKKVMCHLGGAGSNPDGQWTIATSQRHLKKFASNIKDVLLPLGFHGVDLNWENDVVYSQLVDLAKELRKIWPNAVITIPTGMVGEDASDLAGAMDAVDAFMPMTYIPISGWWGGWAIPAPLTPLYGAFDNINDIDHVLTQWENAGVPASKMLMGVGGFGSAWGDGGGAYHNGIGPIAPYVNKGSGPAEDERVALAGDNTVTWQWVKKLVDDNPGKLIEGWDSTGKCSYWHTSSKRQFVKADGMEISLIFYETPRSIGEKLKFVHERGMKGMGFWTLSQMMSSDGSCPILETARP